MSSTARTLGLLLLSAAAVATAGAAPSVAKTARHPGGLEQPLKDGCQRSDFGVGLNTSPQWVFVDKDPTIRRATGVVHVSHPTVDDSPLQHDWYDYNGNLVPDRAFRYLVAGTKGGKTNNFEPPPAGQADEEYGRLHFEWESGTLPTFAWPGDGDHATLWGSWIWDCGHWTTTENNAAGSKITGEHTELHPLNAIVVVRKTPFATKRAETQTDVFVSNDGTKAHAVEQCALEHHPADSSRYDDGFGPCSQRADKRRQRLERAYSFFVPAPPKPAAARLRYRLVNHVRGGSGREKVTVTPTGLAVTVRTKTTYGKTFYVSWSRRAVSPTPLRFSLDSILVKQADPVPSVPDPTPPTWNVYLMVNGRWQLVNEWAPALSSVTDGQVIPVHRTFTFYVPAGGRVWVQVSGKECDIPADTTVFGVYAPIVKPCGPNHDEINPDPLKLLMNDDIGTVLDIYRSAASAVGAHVGRPKAFQRFPGTGRLTLGHGEGDGFATRSSGADHTARPRRACLPGRHRRKARAVAPRSRSSGTLRAGDEARRKRAQALMASTTRNPMSVEVRDEHLQLAQARPRRGGARGAAAGLRACDRVSRRQQGVRREQGPQRAEHGHPGGPHLDDHGAVGHREVGVHQSHGRPHDARRRRRARRGRVDPADGRPRAAGHAQGEVRRALPGRRAVQLDDAVRQRRLPAAPEHRQARG
jgi:hypothetical protein